MKKIFTLFAFIAILSACDNKTETNEGKTFEAAPEFDIKFSAEELFYNINNLPENCDKNPAICAIDLAVRCTIDPKKEYCNKKQMPRFIFMDDESLKRPTEVSFVIEKAKSIDINTAEIYTKSKCNGNWFGLCNGNVIYVLNNKSGSWVVKDIYAIE